MEKKNRNWRGNEINKVWFFCFSWGNKVFTYASKIIFSGFLLDSTPDNSFLINKKLYCFQKKKNIIFFTKQKITTPPPKKNIALFLHYLGDIRSESERSLIMEPSCRSPRWVAIAKDTGGVIMFTGFIGINGASGPM